MSNHQTVKVRRSFIFLMLLLCYLDEGNPNYNEIFNNIFIEFINGLNKFSVYEEDCFIGFSKIMRGG